MNAPSARPRGSGFTRGAIWLGTLLVLSGALGTLLHGQISEADKKKRDAFLKAREEMRTVSSPTPSPRTSPKPKPAAKKKKKSGKSADDAEPAKSPTPKRATAVDDEEETAKKPGAKVSPSPSEAPKAKRKAAADEDDEATPRPTATVTAASPARAVPAPTPRATASLARPSDVPADIVIEKSGVEEEQGFEPPPPPPPRRGFWSRVLGGREPSYRYLSRSVIDAIRRAPVRRSRWKFVIVHNSGTRQGNAKAFDYYHRRVKRMKNGMAYHFVVGNGTSSGDGQIEVGDRWRKQINGGHVHSDYLNNISLGVCLVGDFNRDRPTRAQLEATAELVKFLRERCGRMPVRPHREMNPPRWATDCPGDAFPYNWFRQF